jgi:hypothetical protein
VLKNAATIKDRTGKVVGGVENMTEVSMACSAILCPCSRSLTWSPVRRLPRPR